MKPDAQANIRDLAVTIAPLGQSPRLVMSRLGDAFAVRGLQLSADIPGIRPRELDKSARRDLLATMKRHEFFIAGIDCLIPEAHLTDNARSSRAVETFMQTFQLAADLGRVPVTVHMPMANEVDDIRDLINQSASHLGIRLINLLAPSSEGTPQAATSDMLVGIDTAAWLALGADPTAGILELGEQLGGIRLVDLGTNGLRGPIGNAGGRLDIPALCAALSVHNHEPSIVIDARQWADPVNGALQSAAAWRQIASLGAIK